MKNDYTFKRVFGFTGNENITKGLLNAILDEEVQEVRIDCDKILERDIYNDKLGILDIRAKINDNIDCNIEIQVADSKNIEKRILYYISKIYSQNLKKSHDYVELNKCIGIVFIDFELEQLKDVSKYMTKWNLREREYRKIVLTDAIEFYIIEMPKVEKYAKDSPLDSWVKFIMNSEDIDMDKVDEEIKQAKKVLEDISNDEHEQYLAELREAYIIDMNTMKSSGYKEGKESGRKETKIEDAKMMKDKGINIGLIMEITGLTKEEIDKL